MVLQMLIHLFDTALIQVLQSLCSIALLLAITTFSPKLDGLYFQYFTLPHIVRRNPADSGNVAGVLQTPADSGNVTRSHIQESAGVCRSVLESCGVCRSLLESAGVCFIIY